MHARGFQQASLLKTGIGLIAFYLLLQRLVSYVLGLWVYRSNAYPTPDSRAVIIIVTLVVTVGITWMLAWTKTPKYLFRQSHPPGFGLVSVTTWFYVLSVVLTALLVMVSGFLLQQLDAGPSTQKLAVLALQLPFFSRLLLAFCVVCLVPLMEELLFRGILLSALMQHIGDRVAVVICAVLFAGIHWAGSPLAWYTLAELFVLGVWLAFLRLWSGSLWPAVIAHATNNLLVVTGWFLLAAS